MNLSSIKKIMTGFKVTSGRMILKERKNMHFLQREKHPETYAKALELGLNHIESTILANRTKDVENLEKYIYPRFRNIMDYRRLKDIDVATDLLIKHINNNSHIMLCMDKDCDKTKYCLPI